MDNDFEVAWSDNEKKKTNFIIKTGLFHLRDPKKHASP